jgi:hypothetical protein
MHKSVRFALALLALGFCSRAIPSAALEPTREQVIGPRMMIEATPATKDQFKELLQSDLDVIHVHGNAFEIMVDELQLMDLQSRGIPLTVVNPDVSKHLREIKMRRAPGLGAYTTYSEMIAQINARQASYPSIAQVSTLSPLTHQGRTIYALKISDNVAVDEDEPEVLYMGNHHARELISVMIPLAIADSLLMNYGSDPRFTEWVDERETWIIPIVNPDGFVYVENTDTNWRKNRRINGGGSFGVDPNRNYDYEWGHDNNGSSPSPSSETYRGPSAASEPEIQAVQNFVNAHNFVISLSFHSYGNWWLWGPGYKPALSVDQDIYAGYGAQVQALNGYEPGNPASSTIYLTNGDADDWLYHSPTHSKIIAMTPEVGGPSDGFYPPESRISPLVLQNMEASFLALEHADRPGRLAPPGQPALDPLPTSTTGDYTVTWAPPTTADTEPVVYELVEKTGPSTVTDGLESGTNRFQTGGWATSTARKYAGVFSLYSGNADELNRICLAREGRVVQPGDTFQFRAWYSIETGWYYFYAILSTDGGCSFLNLAGTNTTMSDPNGNNADNGITGSSGGWILMTFDLSAWVGQTVQLGFRYYTDGGVTNEGVYVDEITPIRAWATLTILSSAIAGTSYPVNDKANGTYYYTVRGKDAEEAWGYVSAPSEVVVNVATDVAITAVPPPFSLEANRPNPFARTTQIRFSLPASGDHSLIVYDVNGRRVRTLSQGMREAGPGEAIWDGRDGAGALVPSGVYFYRLDTETGRLEGRAVLRR